MEKTMERVKIPLSPDPFRVIVNGASYVYPAGASVEVPQEVAAEIERYYSAVDKFQEEAPDGFDRIIALLCAADLLPALCAGDRILTDDRDTVIIMY